jgi:predicted HicB family RNase H-like nuclease
MPAKKDKQPNPSYLDIINQARNDVKPENQNNGNQEVHDYVKQDNSKSVEPVKYVNLTIKVDERRRHYWSIEAKKQKTTMTAAMIQGLVDAFGDIDPD